MFIHFYLLYVAHFLNTILFFGPIWRPLWFSALGSRLIRLMVAPALYINYCSTYIAYSSTYIHKFTLNIYK